MTGDRVTEDHVEGVKWIRKAADQRLPEAEDRLGLCYALGRCYDPWGGITNDAAEAVKWYRKAADQGVAKAQVKLGDCYLFGKGVTKDAHEAVEWYRKAAKQGFEPAQSSLGFRYENGQGVPQDFVEAYKWFSFSVAQGNTNSIQWRDLLAQKMTAGEIAQAQYNLGVCYANGDGVAKDEAEAAKWYRKATEQNYAPAQLNLGACYHAGKGVTKDEVEAVKWFRKAAEQNDTMAQYNLGICYDKGYGVEKDEAGAVKWWRKAAEQNYAEAQFNLGNCYHKSEGVPKDDVEAMKWWRKAAEQNLAEAQYNLGLCYYDGEGVPKDYVEAYKWFLLAAAQGDESAKKNMTISENRLTREQIAEGQRLARNFKPRKTPKSDSPISDKDDSDSQPTATGTGFFITEDGFLITNAHVVEDAAQIRLVTSAGLISAKVVKVDAANDLALLKADGKFLPLPVAPSRGVRLGNPVAMVGFPNVGLQGFAPKFARGEIAALSGARDDARYFQISVPVQPGNSGGALVDERGNVVGVVSAKLSAVAALKTSGALPENVNYSVKSSYLLGFLESVPDVAAKLKEVNAGERKFDEVVKSAEKAAVLVLVY